MEVEDVDNGDDEDKPRNGRHVFQYKRRGPENLFCLEPPWERIIRMGMAVSFRSLMFPALVAAFAAAGARAQNMCECDPARPESMQLRQCSLCQEAEKHSGAEVFFLKDISPRKPNRWLALPRRHDSGQHHLHEMPKSERTRLWREAIAKARHLWGEEWGLAYNGSKVRTQCHAHIHIGKLLKYVETDRFVVVSRPEEFPAPPFEGVWVHPAGSKYHVHLGEQTTETVLLR